MTEVAGSLLGSLIDKFLFNVASLFAGAERDVKSLNEELEALKSQLNELDAKSEEEGTAEDAKAWINEVRELSQLIEDVTDKPIIKKPKRRDWGFIARSGKLIGTLNNSNLASNIKNIKALLLEIKERGERYELGESVSSDRKLSRGSSRNTFGGSSDDEEDS